MQLKFVDGWNGGHWELDGRLVVFETAAFNRVMKEHADAASEAHGHPVPWLESYRKAGVDYDMGHEYQWTSLRIRACISHEGEIYTREITFWHISDATFQHLHATSGMRHRS